MREQASPRVGRAAAALLCAALLAVACDSPSAPGRRIPAAIAVVGGADQQGVAGQELPAAIAVKVTDPRGRPVAGQVVTFHVTAGGGSIFSDSATTDAQGIAQERWTVGTVAGSLQTLEARLVAWSGATLIATAAATVTAGAPAQFFRVNASASLVGVVNSVVDDTPAVRAVDANGNRVPGVTVNWAVGAESGTMAAATSVTDANGVAKMAWTLGPSAVYQSLTASIPGLPAVGFQTHVGTLLRTLSPNQGEPVAAGVSMVAAVILNAGFEPLAGVRVQWQASDGGTTVPAATKTASGGGNDGITSIRWTPGPTPGLQTLTATAGSLTVTFTVDVHAQGHRDLVSALPGAVLDATIDRVLWVQPNPSGPRPVKIRSTATNTDVVVKYDSGYAGSCTPPAVYGILFNGGALVSEYSSWYEYRGGSLTALGPVRSNQFNSPGMISVEGQWAAWSSGTEVIRRDLSTGTSNVVASGPAFWVDVGPNGDVAYATSTGAFLYHAGAITPISVEPTETGSIERVETDGVHVTYLTWSGSSLRGGLYLDNGSSDILLGVNDIRLGVGIDHRQNNGWIAWSTGRISRQTPEGTVQQVSPESWRSGIATLGPDGTVVFGDYTTPVERYYLVTPAGARYELGPASGWVKPSDGAFLLIYAGSVYRLSP